ncbi:MAG: RNA polymerase factor sigma-54 [Acidobacteriota bacterium]
MVRRNQLRTALSLNLNLSQRLVMTPSLLQKIELLTLNRLELTDLLNEELAENPVLEEDLESAEAGPSESTEQAKDSEEDTEKYDDFDYEYFFGEYLAPSARLREWESRDDRPSFDVFLAKPSTLSDHLNWQLNLSGVPSHIHEVSYFIIGNIDEDGYLNSSVERIAETLQVSEEVVEEALEVVQGFDPVGVGSRNLQECLLIQIWAAGLQDTLAEKLVQDYLPQIQAKKLREIAKELGCELEEVTEALDLIRRFSPKPGEKYAAQKPIYIQPDVYIHKVDDEYQIVLNDDDLPKLRLSRVYRNLLKSKDTNKETKSFIKERVRSAIELLRSLDQREQTIYRVCSAIVGRQQAFLDNGIMHLRPMLIKDVAEELEVHSSTISRVVAHKYAHTPQGVIELRKFFTLGIEGLGGEDISVVNVKETIKKIIEKENHDKPLSDQKISRVLNDQGIQITRRTVAKYRDQLKIPGSRERKVNGLLSP